MAGDHANAIFIIARVRFELYDSRETEAEAAGIDFNRETTDDANVSETCDAFANGRWRQADQARNVGVCSPRVFLQQRQDLLVISVELKLLTHFRCASPGLPGPFRALWNIHAHLQSASLEFSLSRRSHRKNRGIFLNQAAILEFVTATLAGTFCRQNDNLDEGVSVRRFIVPAFIFWMVATPAAARDGSAYVGLEGGLWFPRDLNGSLTVNYPTATTPHGAISYPGGVTLNAKSGYDVDAVAGYDLGMFRVEGELSYKRANLSGLSLPSQALADLATASSTPPVTSAEIDLVGSRVSVLSGMINALVDFGGDVGIGGYVGAGVGQAQVKRLTDSDSGPAWQLIAGVRAPVADYIDVGLKYRYFTTGSMHFRGEFDLGASEFPYTTSAKVRSHSLLASVTFNLGGRSLPPPQPEPMAVAPPPPAPPATQTCPDGSVVLATTSCPPPPPPPPPPAATEGERGF